MVINQRKKKMINNLLINRSPFDFLRGIVWYHKEKMKTNLFDQQFIGPIGPNVKMSPNLIFDCT